MSAARVGGWSLIVAAIAFMAVFAYLAVQFSYPDVLDGKAADVLPALLAMGGEGRAVWSLYGILPLLLIPAGLGAHAVLQPTAATAARAALVLATISAVSMLLGLFRWPSLQWALAQSYVASGDAAHHAAISAVFDGLNSYLGNFIGEFVGELTMNGFFLTVALGSLRDRLLPRWSAVAGVAAALAGLIGMWRNVTPSVSIVAEVENAILPLWMIILGILFIRADRTRWSDDVIA